MPAAPPAEVQNDTSLALSVGEEAAATRFRLPACRTALPPRTRRNARTGAVATPTGLKTALVVWIKCLSFSMLSACKLQA